MSINETRAILALLRNSAGPFALATLVKVEGSSYRTVGARLILSSDGKSAGSISGGCLEDDVRVHASAVLASGRAESIVYDTTSENDLVWGVGLGCHGIARILVERLESGPAWAAVLQSNLDALRPTDIVVVWSAMEAEQLGTRLANAVPPKLPETGIFRQTIAAPVRIVVCGAGDDAIPLAGLAKNLGWHVTVCDSRSAYATAQRFAMADRIVVAPPGEIGSHIGDDPQTAVVVMTHHYLHDVPLLKSFLPRPLAYLGLLGPRMRAEKILEDLVAQGIAVTAQQREQLRAPVGLDLGSDNPEEVALSIVAEIRSVLAGRDARPLRDRRRPIHG